MRRPSRARRRTPSHCALPTREAHARSLARLPCSRRARVPKEPAVVGRHHDACVVTQLARCARPPSRAQADPPRRASIHLQSRSARVRRLGPSPCAAPGTDLGLGTAAWLASLQLLRLCSASRAGLFVRAGCALREADLEHAVFSPSQFAPAILVTPLGALSVIIGCVCSSWAGRPIECGGLTILRSPARAPNPVPSSRASSSTSASAGSASAGARSASSDRSSSSCVRSPF